MSRFLFNEHSEFIFLEDLGDVNEGIKANGEYINNIR